MAALKIGVLIGSLRKDSYNRRLALALQNLAPDDLSFEAIRIDAPQTAAGLPPNAL